MDAAVAIPIPSEVLWAAVKWIGGGLAAGVLAILGAIWRAYVGLRNQSNETRERLLKVETAIVGFFGKQDNLVTFDKLGPISDRLHTRINAVAAKLDIHMAIEAERDKRKGGA